MGKFKDLTGQKFGRLTVIERAPNKGKQTMWKCCCSCPNHTECVVSAGKLTTGNTNSCGCLRVEELVKRSYKHGHYGSRIYNIWKNMKDRCYNPNSKSYHDYGERRIIVCPEWLDKEKGFMNFYNWSVANGYKNNLTIERIDPNGNYECGNCTWKTRKEQNNNRRNSRFVTYNGKTKTIGQWAEEYSINHGKLYNRLYRGKWSIEKALNTP